MGGVVTGTIFNISRYSIHDGPGIRTTVFFKGCPLDCWWCHNPEGIDRKPHLSMRAGRCIQCGTCVENCPEGAICLSDGRITTDASRCQGCFHCAEVCPAEAREVIGRSVSVDEVMAEIIKDVAFYDESGGGATFSGGEPLKQPAILIALLDECGRLDIHRTVDTCGYASRSVVRQVAERADLFLYDLKHMDSEAHRKFTGVDNRGILDNLKYLASRDAAVRVRFPVIPGVNDNVGNVEKMGTFLRSLNRAYCVDILEYHDVFASKYKRFGYHVRLDAPPAPDSGRLQELAATLSGYGLCVTIGGNEHERTHPQAQTVEP
jgi:pyruvate formate lyase activating enzyme